MHSSWQPIRSWSDVPGYITLDRAQFITQQLGSLPRGSRVLEVGSLYGRTSWLILDHLGLTGTLTVVECFDRWLDDRRQNCDLQWWHTERTVNRCTAEPRRGPWLTKPQVTVWHWCMQQHPYFEQLELKPMTSREFMKTTESLGPWDLVWLDGNHQLSQVLEELEFYSHCTDRIVGDDYVRTDVAYLKVPEAIDLFLADHPDWQLTVVDQCWSLVRTK